MHCSMDAAVWFVFFPLKILVSRNCFFLDSGSPCNRGAVPWAVTDLQIPLYMKLLQWVIISVKSGLGEWQPKYHGQNLAGSTVSTENSRKRACMHAPSTHTAAFHSPCHTRDTFIGLWTTCGRWAMPCMSLQHCHETTNCQPL
jgi:hypothetical protein